MNIRKLLSKIIDYFKDFFRPEMINPRFDLKGKHIKEGNIYCIIPKHHGCTIEIVSAKNTNQDKDVKRDKL